MMKSSGNKLFVSFGEVLRYFRQKEGISQEQLADNICSREYINLIEKGKKIPTLYMVDAFSKKMSLNLFDAYGLIINHHDFDTHIKIEELNKAISSHDNDRLFELANEYSTLPGFLNGIPYQCIMHAYSLYYSEVLHDNEKSIFYADKGLSISGIRTDQAPTSMLTNLDICLLVAKSVALCRSGNRTDGRQALEYLYECTLLRIIENRYIANRNRRFDINIYAMTIFNICEFFPDDTEKNLDLLNKALKLLNEYDCSSKQSELLLYKARYLFEQGHLVDAYNYFNAGYFLKICKSSQKEAEICAKDILKSSYYSLNKHIHNVQF